MFRMPPSTDIRWIFDYFKLYVLFFYLAKTVGYVLQFSESLEERACRI